ncbi:MAG: efflux RND transporter periplasmic adaptor subunit [Dysgonamonadaceae bacterium]|jgi:RND family efflux transporter MFP subunit|nr:efflux RND transporter periplasmic adaptor subunit [Dysgonamonadaceae bacterium]
MKRKIVFRFLPLVCAVVLASCGGSEKKQEEGANKRAKVNTTIARTQPVERISTYTATVQADVINQITPATPGRIEKIFVEVGDRVQKGQLLVQMDASNLLQQTKQLENLERDYQRYNELLAVGGIAQQQVDQIKTQIDVLRTAINNINDNTQLRSPIYGVVTARNYDNGDVYAAQPIITVQQLNPVKARINVSESYFAKVKLGMSVDLNLDVYENEQFTGKVTLIYPTIDATTHTFGVEITIDNRDLKVRPGMYARVMVNFGTGESIVIPDRAVQKQAGANDKYVFTVVDGIARYNKVELGQRIGENYEIRAGINDGDVIVTDGQTRLIDGTEVEVLNQ